MTALDAMVVEGLKQRIREEREAKQRRMARQSVRLSCCECGARFSRKRPSALTECPRCGGSDIEVGN
jgi:Zn finger protein HypA/HybF involved in hydrogenase expression